MWAIGNGEMGAKLLRQDTGRLGERRVATGYKRSLCGEAKDEQSWALTMEKVCDSANTCTDNQQVTTDNRHSKTSKCTIRNQQRPPTF
jgi:hypothetical protein